MSYELQRFLIFTKTYSKWSWRRRKCLLCRMQWWLIVTSIVTSSSLTKICWRCHTSTFNSSPVSQLLTGARLTRGGRTPTSCSDCSTSCDDAPMRLSVRREMTIRVSNTAADAADAARVSVSSGVAIQAVQAQREFLSRGFQNIPHSTYFSLRLKQ